MSKANQPEVFFNQPGSEVYEAFEQANNLRDLEEAKQQRVHAAGPKLSNESIEHLISTLKICPITSSWADITGSGPDEVFLGFNPDEAINRSGVDKSELRDTSTKIRYPHFKASFDAAARQVLADSGVVYGTEEALSANYSLSITEDRKIWVKQIKICSSKHIGTISELQLSNLHGEASGLISERQAGVARRDIEVSRTAKEFVENSTAKKPRKTASASTANLTDELGMLTVDGTTILLPSAQLSQYDEIKHLMLNAGGKYESKKGKSFFSFPDGMDAKVVLETLQSGKTINVKQENQFFGTPKPVGDEALATLGNIRGKRVLEPSAGDGALADLARAKEADVVTIENWAVNVKKLQSKGYDVIERDFLSIGPDEIGTFDAVLMNPPFSNRQDIAHISHALSFLNSTGELTAIMSPQFQTATFQVSEKFRKLMELAGAEITPIEKGAFKDSGTGVATVMVHLKMEKLLAALDANQESDATHGVDLSRARAHAAQFATSKPMKFRV